MIKVNSLEKGACFGELALINAKPRSATIIADEDWEWAVLDKKHFNVILK